MFQKLKEKFLSFFSRKNLSLWLVGYQWAYSRCLAAEPLREGQIMTVWGLDHNNVYTEGRSAQHERFVSCRGVALEDLEPGEVGRFQRFYMYYDYLDENCGALLVVAFDREDAISVAKNSWKRWEKDTSGDGSDDFVFDAVPFPIKRGLFPVEDLAYEVSFDFKPVYKPLSQKEGDARGVTALMEKN